MQLFVIEASVAVSLVYSSESSLTDELRTNACVLVTRVISEVSPALKRHAMLLTAVISSHKARVPAIRVTAIH